MKQRAHQGVVFYVIISPNLQQQINISRMMDSRYRDDPFLAGLPGYRCGAADSVLAWRTSHLQPAP